MSGISGSGRHVASHAKPGAISGAKGKVKTAAAVTSVLAVSGGVATAFHVHQDGLRNSAESASQDSNTAAAAAAVNALAVRAANTAANRDLARPALAQSSASTSASGAPTSPLPSSDASASAAPVPVPSSTSTSTTRTPLPTQTSTSTATKTPLPTKTSTSTPTSASSSSSSSSSSTNLGIGDSPTEARALAETIVPSGQFACFANIISRESSWNIYATNPSSGAYGLGQALPGNKMASMGPEWRNSALLQIKWALSYMTGRYGSPCAAWTFWQAHDWY